MRIVIVSDYGYVSGGAAQVAIKSAVALAERGVEVTFACALGPPSPELERPGITVHCLGASNIWAVRQRWRAAAQGVWNTAAGHWLRALLHGCDPRETVVHLHQWTKAFSPSVLSVAATCGLPFVVTLHDYFLICPNGAYFVYPRQRPCTVQPMSAACWATDCDARSIGHKAVRLLRQIATGAAVRRRSSPLHVIHVSHRAADVARPLLPPSTSHWILQNPVSEAVGPRVAAEHNHAVVFVGRVTVEKGCVVLARAAARARMPLVVMGEGPALEQVRQANPDVDIRRWGDRAAVDRCFADARVVALPSLWYETGGLVVREALARGVPAIVTTISGAADAVGDEHGLLVPPGDVDALTDALRRMRDDSLVRRLSEQAYRSMSSGPQRPAAHADGLLNIYRSILAEHLAQAA
jgi:glycosyltransferase involved in cell wall biosynthesis